MWPGDYFQALFNFQAINCKSESEEVPYADYGEF